MLTDDNTIKLNTVPDTNVFQFTCMARVVVEQAMQTQQQKRIMYGSGIDLLDAVDNFKTKVLATPDGKALNLVHAQLVGKLEF